MENFVLPESTDTLKDSRQLLNNALLTVRSLSAGTSFPTDNVSVGMLCYRTDQEKYYQNTGTGTWSEEINLTAKNATSATKDNLGNVINDFYVDKTSTQSITGTKVFSAYPILSEGVRLPAGKSVSWFAGNPETGQSAGSIHNGEYTGNSATATKLKTARTINGISFDGTGDITIVNTIAQGGTGATTAEEARENLGINALGVVPTGTIIAYAANSAPDGYLLCNGANVSRATYADLFATIGTTYGTGDGSTTFALPNLANKFLQGSSTAGTAKAAGLPAHKHFGFTSKSRGTSADDRNTQYLTATQQVSSLWYGGYASYNMAKNSDAADVGLTSDPTVTTIYGKSTTVQPPALTTRFYIKY